LSNPIQARISSILSGVAPPGAILRANASAGSTCEIADDANDKRETPNSTISSITRRFIIFGAIRHSSLKKITSLIPHTAAPFTFILSFKRKKYSKGY
jgi:hypothetical protein